MAHQQNLFDTSPPEWEVDKHEQRLVATIVLPAGAKGVYDYLVPEKFCNPDHPEWLLQAGRRVSVPFGRGNRQVQGYCVGLETRAVPTQQLKAIAAVIDSSSLLTPPMLRLTQWMADYYLCPWGKVLEAVVPAGVRRLAGTRQVTLLEVPPDVMERLDQVQLGSKQQRKALQTLAASSQPLTASQLADASQCTTGPIKQLLKRGLLEAKTKRISTDKFNEAIVERQQPLSLNADQKLALYALQKALDSAETQGIVLHGVTGSGKTEVYL
ncbi:MAG TPA: primosomal protein N', partial [Planctomycetaceae bacterium]|nr:primosomal protein N' [Planctomycetaceae bacterium]